jgi:putative tricarboxylic transport membrane protein
VALLLPITYNLDPTSAFIMFAGIYYGAMYGGSTTSILLNTPGESGSIVTAIDGNMMARKGRGAQALATAAIGSSVAGTIATVALTFVAPLMVKLALLFGPAEFFALMVLALVTVTAVLGDSLPRGLASLFFGLALGLVGIDLQTGQARFTLGIPELLDGIDTVVVAVGLFAIGETLYVAARARFETEEIYAIKGSMWMSKED